MCTQIAAHSTKCVYPTSVYELILSFHGHMYDYNIYYLKTFRSAFRGSVPSAHTAHSHKIVHAC